MKVFGEYCDIQIAVDDEMKLKIYYISICWFNCSGYIVYIVYL